MSHLLACILRLSEGGSKDRSDRIFGPSETKTRLFPIHFSCRSAVYNLTLFGLLGKLHNGNHAAIYLFYQYIYSMFFWNIYLNFFTIKDILSMLLSDHTRGTDRYTDTIMLQ